jgi:hypothetical protein
VWVKGMACVWGHCGVSGNPFSYDDRHSSRSASCINHMLRDQIIASHG